MVCIECKESFEDYYKYCPHCGEQIPDEWIPYSPNGPFEIIGDELTAYIGYEENVVIPKGVTKIGAEVFEFCNDIITSVTIPDGVTRIGDSAFRHCTKLTEIIIPDSVRVIEANAFRECTGLENIIIPEGVTEIGDYAFRGCGDCNDIIIPNSVKNIGKFAFTDCRGFNVVCPVDVAGEWIADMARKEWTSDFLK